MIYNDDRRDRSYLSRIAHRVMLERGLAPDFTEEAIAELHGIKGPASFAPGDMRDLRGLAWCSIDNDDSLDLDQLTVAEALPGGEVKIMIAVADVDALVGMHSALDDHARENTTSVYTIPETFPMLPLQLSNDFTSLNARSDRVAFIIEMVFAGDGALKSSALYRAMVCNKAKLAYNSLAAWFDHAGPEPQGIASVPGLMENLKLQDLVASKLRAARHGNGGLILETIQAHPVFSGDELMNLVEEKRNRAKDLIEDFMIAANGVTARYLALKEFPSLQRVVRKPKRWDRIVELASERGAALPEEPDSKELEKFLLAAKTADPVRFPDLSLSVVKLLGRGEYVAQSAGSDPIGHFGLAVSDYAHSTAPNRRYPDLIAQRLLKAAVMGAAPPYGIDELESLAEHCTQAEDAANKVERQVMKSAAAILLESRIGERFEAIVTGASEKGTWVRLLNLPVEGRLEIGFSGVDVGNKLMVQLIHTDVERGFIDFKKLA